MRKTVIILAAALSLVCLSCGSEDSSKNTKEQAKAGEIGYAAESCNKNEDAPEEKKSETDRQDDSQESSNKIIIEPTKIPTPAPTEAPEPNPEGVSESDIAKISKELKELDGSAEAVEVEIYFGDCYEGGEKLLKERYPEEYAAYSNPDNWNGKQDDKVTELVIKGSELHNTLPLTWYKEQEAEFFKKNPELKNYLADTDEYMRLVLRIPYSKMLWLAMDEQVLEILPYENSKIKYDAQVIGEYKGRKVYDLVYFPGEYGSTDDEHEAGGYDCYLRPDRFAAVDDNDYLRITLEIEDVKEQNGKIKEGAAEKCLEKIRNFGWPVVEEGKSPYYNYITVLVTRPQLLEKFPGLKSMLTSIFITEKQEVDDSTFINIYYAGYIRGRLNGLELGDEIK